MALEVERDEQVWMVSGTLLLQDGVPRPYSKHRRVSACTSSSCTIVLLLVSVYPCVKYLLELPVPAFLVRRITSLAQRPLPCVCVFFFGGGMYDLCMNDGDCVFF